MDGVVISIVREAILGDTVHVFEAKRCGSRWGDKVVNPRSGTLGEDAVRDTSGIVSQDA